MDEMRVDILAAMEPPTRASTKLSLRWARIDPLAVSLTVLREPDHPSLMRGEWVMLRDFLRYGLEAPTGDGNVRLRPGEPATVVIDLTGDRGRCSMSVPAAVVRDFLDATERVVAAGEERSEEELDRLLEELLGRGHSDPPEPR
ncbi:MAG: sporulation and cell division protein SsgA [Frankiales bacterium]|nr:sporulation and cell division protein SsgA [Frankiales bacterium]